MARQGAPDVAVTTSTAAAFVDFQPWRDRHSVLRAGVRGEWQRRGGGVPVAADRGSAVVPRLRRGPGRGLVCGALVAGAPFRGGAARQAADVHVVRSRRRDRRAGVALCLRRGASGDDDRARTGAPARRRRSVVVAAPGGPRKLRRAEETWTHGGALAGLSRLRDSRGLVDVLASDRRLRRWQTHVTAGLKLARLSLGAHYEMLRSSDDTEGAFSLPGTPPGPHR